MPDQVTPSMPVIVALPAEIDVTNAEEVFGQICAALEPGVDVVIADLTATVFCDSSGLRHLLFAQQRARERDVQLRLAIPPDCPVRRVLELTGAYRMLTIYPDLAEAASEGLLPRPADTRCPPASAAAELNADRTRLDPG
jgi:anti-sigma B factor antagonist